MFIATSSNLMTTPQLYSTDYYIRLSRAVLEQTVLSHLFSAPDPAVLADASRIGLRTQRAGYTEWSAEAAGVTISIAWDWVELADGDIRLFQAVAPRTNLRLLDSDGYDLPAEESQQLLWIYIESHPWRLEVSEALKLDSQFGMLTPGCSRFN